MVNNNCRHIAGNGVQKYGKVVKVISSKEVVPTGN